MIVDNTKYERLLSSILGLLLHKGLKGLTMDLLASNLSMSKRTLYEIFGSKHHLISEALDYLFRKMREMSTQIFKEAPNTMAALSEMFYLQGELLCVLTIDFFHDIDTFYPEIGRLYKEKHEQEKSAFASIYEKGIEEGVFRNDVNIVVLSAIMDVQMEALKRVEDRLGGDFTLEEIFFTITQGFLRSIASPKGLEIIESFRPTDNHKHYLSFLNS